MIIVIRLPPHNGNMVLQMCWDFIRGDNDLSRYFPTAELFYHQTKARLDFQQVVNSNTSLVESHSQIDAFVSRFVTWKEQVNQLGVEFLL